jgi:hypothetical protein
MQPYRRLEYACYLEPLAPELTSCIPKIYPPEHFRERFSDQTSVQIIPLTGDIYEACLYLLETGTMTPDALQRALQDDTANIIAANPVLRSRGFQSLKSGSAEQISAILATKLKITIYLVDAHETMAIFADMELSTKNNAIVLFKNDIGKVFPVVINDTRMLHAEAVEPIMPVKRKNPLLQHYTSREAVNLQKLSLASLQREAIKRGCSAMREGCDGLLVMKTRDDLITELSS